jgi:hypothetical protein
LTADGSNPSPSGICKSSKITFGRKSNHFDGLRQITRFA